MLDVFINLYITTYNNVLSMFVSNRLQARNGSKDVIDFSTSLVWMEAKDMCDPETLKNNSEVSEKTNNAHEKYHIDTT